MRIMPLKKFLEEKIDLRNRLRMGYIDGVYLETMHEMEDFIVVETPAHLEEMTKEILEEAELFKVQLKTDNPKLDADPEDIDEWFEEIVKAVTGKRYNWGYSDEYITCSNCGLAVCITPDYQNWQPDFWANEGEFLCGDCVREESDSYIEFLTNNPHAANTIVPEQVLREHGFERVTGRDYSSGFGGAGDDPQKVFAEFQDTHDVIFNIRFNNPFYVEWDVYIRRRLGEKGCE